MNVVAYLQASRLKGNLTGVSRHIQQMISGLARREGVEVSLLTSAKDLQDGRLPPDNPLAGIPIHTFSMSRALTERLWYALHRPRLERWCPRADWVYCTTEVFVPTRRVRSAVTIHDLVFLEDNSGWDEPEQRFPTDANWRRKLETIARRADLLLSVSQFTKDRAVALLGVKPERIRVIGNGVDDRFFHPERSRHARAVPAGKYMLVLGGVSVRKGAPHLLAVAKALQERGSPIKIVVTGTSAVHYTPRLKAYPNIMDLGFTSDEELPALIHDSLGLLFLSNYEGFGMPVLEAMAAGTAVIASNRTSLPEVAGDAGLIVEPTATGEIVTLIEKLAADPAFRASAVERGRIRARGFTWDRCVDRLVDALTEASPR